MNTEIKDLSPKEVYNECLSDNVVLLDVRNSAVVGFKCFDVARSVHLCADEMEEKWIVLPLNKKFIIADLSGNTSVEIALFLQEQGFDVAVLQGGMENWLKMGLGVIDSKENRQTKSCACFS